MNPRPRHPDHPNVVLVNQGWMMNNMQCSICSFCPEKHDQKCSYSCGPGMVWMDETTFVALKLEGLLEPRE